MTGPDCPGPALAAVAGIPPAQLPTEALPALLAARLRILTGAPTPARPLTVTDAAIRRPVIVLTPTGRVPGRLVYWPIPPAERRPRRKSQAAGRRKSGAVARIRLASGAYIGAPAALVLPAPDVDPHALAP